jgi:hypothetical protein
MCHADRSVPAKREHTAEEPASSFDLHQLTAIAPSSNSYQLVNVAYSQLTMHNLAIMLLLR